MLRVSTEKLRCFHGEDACFHGEAAYLYGERLSVTEQRQYSTEKFDFHGITTRLYGEGARFYGEGLALMGHRTLLILSFGSRRTNIFAQRTMNGFKTNVVRSFTIKLRTYFDTGQRESCAQNLPAGAKDVISR